ncbi:MAG: hypothetical protein RLZZ630_506 [Bacteroidota bacterium]|jgi:RNA polymerase sigma factor (sigma-70 family)
MESMIPLRSVDQDELIIALRSGDEQALRQVYRAHYTMVVNMVTNNAGSLQEAKDVYQETIIVFYENIRREGFELNCRLKTYLYSVARRIWLKQLERKKKFNGRIEDSDEFVELGMEEESRREEQFAAMHVALESLGEPCRSILKDFYLNKQSMEEITLKFGYTNTDNTKNQKYKCLKRLKKLFFDALPASNE